MRQPLFFQHDLLVIQKLFYWLIVNLASGMQTRKTLKEITNRFGRPVFSRSKAALSQPDVGKLTLSILVNLFELTAQKVIIATHEMLRNWRLGFYRRQPRA